MSPSPLSTTAQPQGFISSTPTPITRFLLLASPYAKGARRAVEVVLWRGRRGGKAEGWAVVVAWWALCLGGWEAMRYLLPPLLLFLYLLPSIPLPQILRSSPISSPPGRLPTKKKDAPTAQTLLTTVSDFSSIHSLLSQAWPEWLELPDRRLEAFGWTRVARGLAGVWVVWVVGGWVLGLRVMLGLIGTVLLLLPSPYFRPLLNATQSSYLLRRTIAFTSLIVLGPPPSYNAPFPMESTFTNPFSWAWAQSKTDIEGDASTSVKTRGRSNSIKEVWAGLASAIGVGGEKKKLPTTKEEGQEAEEWQEEPVQFRFEVMENQRWWLALDWTTTLAPSDRPVWCDTHLNPTPPPSQFTLPPASTIVLPDPTSPTSHQLQRTAIWHWLDPDWSIALHLPNSPGATSFIPAPRSPTISTYPLPSKVADAHAPLSPSTGKTMSLGEQALSRGLERLKAVSGGGSTPSLASLTGSSSAGAGGAGGVSTGHARSGSMEAGGSSTGKTLFAMSQPEGGGASTASASASAAGVAETMLMEVDDLDAGTDEGGWSYGGNKWEGMGPKGGLGKFTRRRRWTRLALLTEHVQRLPLPLSLPTNLSPASSSSPALPSSTTPATTLPPTPIGLPRRSSLSRSPTREKNLPLPPAMNGEAIVGSGLKGGGETNGALRMRLKKAVEGGGVGGGVGH